MIVDNITFLYPYVFLLFGLYIWCAIFCKVKQQSIYFSNIKLLQTITNKQNNFMQILKFLIVFFMLISLSSPVQKKEVTLNNAQGYEISLILDASGSMREDNKFNKTKKILERFINKRSTDRLALSVFADFAYVAVPLTYDKNSLLKSLKFLKIGVAGQRETSLNEALFLSSDLFKNSKKSFVKKPHKIAILLTDGLDTTASIPLDIAIKKAKKYDLKVYTIGIGKKGDYNPKVLKKIAKQTGGKFYQTQDLSKLENIYTQIDNLEKTKIETKKYIAIRYLYQYPLALAILLLILLLILTYRNKQNKSLNTLFSKDMYKKIVAGIDNKKLYNIFLISSLMFMFISLYRPTINSKNIDISQNNFSLVVAFDISKSMNAKDIFPTRALFAQNKFKHLIDNFKGQKVGVFGFSNDSVLISPITNDYDSIRYLVKNVDLNQTKTNGSNIMSALKTTNKLLENINKKVVIIFTDGTENSDFNEEIVYANKHNISVFIYAIATAKGTTISDTKGLLKDIKGNIVVTRLNYNIKQLANQTNGEYLEYSVNSSDIDKFTKIINEKFKDNMSDDFKIENNKELFYIPLFLAFIFYMLAISGYSRGKR